MSFYSDLATDANALLLEFGQPVTLRHETSAGYANGKPVTATSTDYVGTGVEVLYTAKDFQNTLIQIGDKKLLFSPLLAARHTKSSRPCRRTAPPEPSFCTSCNCGANDRGQLVCG